MGARNKVIDNASKIYLVKVFDKSDVLDEFLSSIREEFKVIGMQNIDSKPLKQYKSYPAISIGREILSTNEDIFDVEIKIDIVLRNNYYQDYVFDYTFDINFYSDEIHIEHYESFEDENLIFDLENYKEFFGIDNVKEYLTTLKESIKYKIDEIEEVFKKYSEWS